MQKWKNNVSHYSTKIMKYNTAYFGLLCLLAIFGCGQTPDSASRAMGSEEAALGATAQTALEAVERKLIKTGSVAFETNDIHVTRKNILATAEKYGGYVSSDQEFRTSGQKSNTIVLRVAADNFDNVLKEATHGIDKFERKEISVQDVTEEFLDIEARLKTKKELEQRYIALLKQANTVSEIREIEREIGQLRAEIESVEGRLKYLQDQVSLSTLTVTFYERLPNQTAFVAEFKASFREGWENLIRFFIVLTAIWPFILLGVGILIGIRMYRKRK